MIGICIIYHLQKHLIGANTSDIFLFVLEHNVFLPYCMCIFKIRYTWLLCLYCIYMCSFSYIIILLHYQLCFLLCLLSPVMTALETGL